MGGSERAPKAVVVGGSIAGLCCASALVRAGWEVVVVEKAVGPSSSSSTGAGLGLHHQAYAFISSLLPSPDLLSRISHPLSIDENRFTDRESKTSRAVTRDEEFGFQALYWSDLHSVLYESISGRVVVFWGHQFLSLVDYQENAPVRIEVKVLRTGETVEIAGDLLIAADGCLSSIRQHFLPDHRLRYSGYVAWRGVYDFSKDRSSPIIPGLRNVYPDLGNCLYFDLAEKTHSVLYELKGKRMNWLWYVNQHEPELEGKSVTMKVDNDLVKKMHDEAEKVWVPELTRLIKETKEPFINVIYDSEPLPRLFWGNVVLVGDAAHPTTPHGLRSTNMSANDAEVLAWCLKKWGLEKLASSLEEYQSIRLPVVSQQVLHARRLGRLKQGLALENGASFDPKLASPEECLRLAQRSMPWFDGVPITSQI